MNSIDEQLIELDNISLEEEEVIEVKIQKDKRRRKIIAMKLEEAERKFGRKIDAGTFIKMLS